MTEEEKSKEGRTVVCLAGGLEDAGMTLPATLASIMSALRSSALPGPK